MKTKRKGLCFFAFALALLCATSASGQTTLFTTGSTTTNGKEDTYRIPAIVRLNNGSLMAFSDRREGGSGDIGSGIHIEIYSRTSTDNGSIWSEQTKAIEATASSGYNYAHGDASTVVDRESGAILVMTASGTDGFTSNTSQRPLVARSVSTDNGTSWTTTEVSNKLYSNRNVSHLFFSSGRMIQSRLYKKDKYYRIYAGVCTQSGSRVVYSDDFGQTWSYLGGNSATPVSVGDECKVEELPDGSILLSTRSRSVYGRHFNVFKFTDLASASGSWGSYATSSDSSTGTCASQCNGEILLVPAKDADGKATYILLQSAPASTDRTNMKIYWKVLPSDYTTPSNYVSGWKSYDGLSSSYFAYSTMTIDQKGDIAFLAERSGYSGVDFEKLSLSTITNGSYSYNPSAEYHPTSDPSTTVTVAAPTFSLHAGTYTGDQAVELSTTASDATIYYTTDGTNPTAASTKYDGTAITLTEGTTTLKAVAVDANGHTSAVASATYSIVAETTNGQSKTGTVISFDITSSSVLFSNGASSSDPDLQYFGYLRHNISHVQMLTSNSSDLDTSSSGAGLFAQNNNDMLFTEHTVDGVTKKYLGFYSGNSGKTPVYLAIVAPKGYRFLRYQMEFDAGDTDDGSSVAQYTYGTDNAVTEGTSFSISKDNTTWDQTLSSGTNVLFFHFTFGTAAASNGIAQILLKSLQLTYAIDDPFTAQVPSASGDTEVHTGLLDLGSFSSNKDTYPNANNGKGYWSFDRDRKITDDQVVNVYNTDGELQNGNVVTVDDGQYFVAASDGDYYIEAPAKFRITGATVNFLRSEATANISSTTYREYTPSPSTSNVTVIIGDGSGNYLKMNSATEGVNTTNPAEATQFTMSYYSSSHWWGTTTGYTLTTSDGYYLYMKKATAAFRLSTSIQLWGLDRNGLTFDVNNSTKHIYYGGGYWGYTSDATSANGHLYQVAKSTSTTYTAGDFTGTVYTRDNSGAATDGTKTLTSNNSSASVTVSDFNNDAVHINISGLPSGAAALYNVNLTLLPLNPEVQTMQVGALINNKAVGTTPVTSLNYTFNNGNAVLIPVPSDASSPYTIVFRNAENAEKTLWYTTGANNNNLATTGGYSNYFLVKSAADAGGSLVNDVTPYPGARVNANQAGTVKLNATNIADVVAGEASQLKDNVFNEDDATYETVSLKNGDSKEVYVYSADVPTFNIMPSNMGTKHIDYRYYTITVEPVVQNETPVITFTPIYSETLKGASHKTGGRAQDDGTKELDKSHTYVGVTVQSENPNGGTVYGVLTNQQITDAIKTEIAKQNYYGFDSNDPLRGILYVDMSGLTTVTADAEGETAWESFNAGSADNCLYFMPESFTTNKGNTIHKVGTKYEAVGDITVYDQQPFFTPYDFTTGTYKAIYTREGTSHGTAVKATVKNMTAVLPFNITLNSDGNPKTSSDAVDTSIKFYDITGSGDVTATNGGNELTYAVVATPVTEGVAKANQPYYVTSENPGFSFNITGAQFAKTPETPETLTRTPSATGAWKATGTYSGIQPQTAPNLWYFSQDLFWKSSNLKSYTWVNIRPFRAYFINPDANAKADKAIVVFDPDEIVTGIHNIESDNGSADSPVYDLMGRRVSGTLQKGVYVKKGKKILVK